MYIFSKVHMQYINLVAFLLQAVPPVIHRDIKAANILLDESMRARVIPLCLELAISQ